MPETTWLFCCFSPDRSLSGSLYHLLSPLVALAVLAVGGEGDREQNFNKMQGLDGMGLTDGNNDLVLAVLCKATTGLSASGSRQPKGLCSIARIVFW